MTRQTKTLLLNVGLAVAYFLAGRAGLMLAFDNQSATPVWPPTGISLAALLIFGYRLAPGVLVGAFFTNLATTGLGSFWPSCGIALGNALEAVLGAWLVNRFAGGTEAFGRTHRIFKYFGLAALATTTISATMGVASLYPSGFIAPGRSAPVWLTWWIGDLVSNVIIAPLLLIWRKPADTRWTQPAVVEFAIWLALVLATGEAVFGNWLISGPTYALEYLTIPPVLCAAWRFGLRGASAAALALSAVAVIGTLHGLGPFAVNNRNEALVLVGVFMATITVTADVLASVISERKTAEQAVRESQSRLAGLVDSAMDAIVTTDMSQRIVLYNRAAEAMFGFPAREMIGQPLSRLLPERHRQAHGSHVKTFGEAGATSRRMGALGAVSGLRASGEEFPIEASISHVQISGQKFFTVILRDITERERMERALRDAQKQLEAHAQELESTVAARTSELRDALSDLEAFSYSVSHDLRAPLRVMRQYSEVLLEDHGEMIGESGRDFLRRIALAAERLDTLIHDLLEYNRVVRSELRFETVELERMLAEVIEKYPDLWLDREHIRIERPLLPVRGSEAFLTQCLSNLLANALKFVKPGDTPEVTVRTEQRDSKVRLWIEDKGIGIDPQHHSRIFGIFERLHTQSEYDGTGIGLAIVRKAVERMGGTVGFDSAAGAGAKFWIELPAAN